MHPASAPKQEIRHLPGWLRLLAALALWVIGSLVIAAVVQSETIAGLFIVAWLFVSIRITCGGWLVPDFLQ
jgi:hypothetical protein